MLWQGVSQLPDFKTNFPKWQPKAMREAVPQKDRLNDAGIDLVQQVSMPRALLSNRCATPPCVLGAPRRACCTPPPCLPDRASQMLAYTPNARITAKDALEHHYFKGLNRDTVGMIPLPF